jgi:hypothetical protein
VRPFRWQSGFSLAAVTIILLFFNTTASGHSASEAITAIPGNASLKGNLEIPHTAFLNSGTLSIEDYWQLVAATQTLVDELQETPVEALQPQLAEIASQWKNVRNVMLDDGTSIPIDPTYLVALLRANPPDLNALETHLDALVGAQKYWPQNQFSGQDLVPLATILSRPDFQWKEPTPSPLQQWWDALMRRLRDFLTRIPGNGILSVNTSFLEYLLLGVGGLVIALLLAYALRGIWKSVVSETDLSQEAKDNDEGLTTDSALQKARELSNSGDYRLAVRYLYLSSLLLLEERGVLRYDRSWTNREYLRSVAHIPELAMPLSEVIEVFDRVWYGYQPLDDTTFQHYADSIAQVRQQK